MRDPAYFDRIYTESEDPYGFDRNDYEQLKFAHLLAVCGDGPFVRALELGCAVGSLTELLAPRCRELVAVDISSAAVTKAAERVERFTGVSCETRNLPSELPSGEFDLIVASDVLYYWTRADVEAGVRRLSSVLKPGGALVAAHYVPPWGVLLTGNEVHDILRSTAPLKHVLEERVEFGTDRPYRVDRYERH
jgi:predicted TPR repeat methyltransferase